MRQDLETQSMETILDELMSNDKSNSINSRSSERLRDALYEANILHDAFNPIKKQWSERSMDRFSLNDTAMLIDLPTIPRAESTANRFILNILQPQPKPINDFDRNRQSISVHTANLVRCRKSLEAKEYEKTEISIDLHALKTKIQAELEGRGHYQAEAQQPSNTIQITVAQARKRLVDIYNTQAIKLALQKLHDRLEYTQKLIDLHKEVSKDINLSTESLVKLHFQLTSSAHSFNAYTKELTYPIEQLHKDASALFPQKKQNMQQPHDYNNLSFNVFLNIFYLDEDAQKVEVGLINASYSLPELIKQLDDVIPFFLDELDIEASAGNDEKMPSYTTLIETALIPSVLPPGQDYPTSENFHAPPLYNQALKLITLLTTVSELYDEPTREHMKQRVIDIDTVLDTISHQQPSELSFMLQIKLLELKAYLLTRLINSQRMDTKCVAISSPEITLDDSTPDQPPQSTSLGSQGLNCCKSALSCLSIMCETVSRSLCTRRPHTETLEPVQPVADDKLETELINTKKLLQSTRENRSSLHTLSTQKKATARI